MAGHTPLDLKLWFAFDLWISYICNNNYLDQFQNVTVVICFRSLNILYLQQPQHLRIDKSNCCDLLSIFEYLIFATTVAGKYDNRIMLWFAFDLWISYICNNAIFFLTSNRAVVICFRSLNILYLQQQNQCMPDAETRCDLLSIFEYLIFATTYSFSSL